VPLNYFAMKNYIKFLLAIFLIITSSISIAQNCGSSYRKSSDFDKRVAAERGELNLDCDSIIYTCQPDSNTGKDAMVRDDDPNTNHGNEIDFIANAWTAQGNAFIQRSFIDFDFGNIPSNAIITDARLSLFFNPLTGHYQHQSPLSGSNACWLKRIITPWQENSITWNNQPNTDDSNMVALPQSTSSTQDYQDIDITNLVIERIQHPNSNYGFMLALQTEQLYRCLVFASSDNTIDSIRPEIKISYCLPSGITENKKEDFKVFPNPTSENLTLSNKIKPDEIINVKLFDSNGNFITEYLWGAQPSLSIDTYYLSQGLYYLRLQSKSEIKIIKFAVIKDL